MLNFVHIPKTAGTSFRLGAEQVFDRKRIAYDYNHKSKETSDAVEQHIYGDIKDPWQLFQDLKQQQVAMIAGHVRADKYTPLCGVNNAITFVREPLQRLASEYHHFVRHHGFKGGFDEFYNLPRMQDRMHKMLAGVPLEAFGLVGVTERYSDSLALIHKRFSVQIPDREDNLGNERVGNPHDIPKEQRDILINLNKKDIALFRKADRLLEERLKLFKAGKPWVHGQVTHSKKNKISGWAWYEASDEPVKLSLSVGGDYVGEASATMFWPSLARYAPPRGSFVGFEFAGSFNADAPIECVVEDTGQVLTGLGKVRLPKT